jgi:hypothetical protein
MGTTRQVIRTLTTRELLCGDLVVVNDVGRTERKLFALIISVQCYEFYRGDPKCGIDYDITFLSERGVVTIDSDYKETWKVIRHSPISLSMVSEYDRGAGYDGTMISLKR